MRWLGALVLLAALPWCDAHAQSASLSGARTEGALSLQPSHPAHATRFDPYQRWKIPRREREMDEVVQRDFPKSEKVTKFLSKIGRLIARLASISPRPGTSVAVIAF
ncbi:MAG TPA: hypothetical protein VJ376_10340 [Pseudomonadota bacterium]|nr:hypothetical protein [Pseudomonadota bacterium]